MVMVWITTAVFGLLVLAGGVMGYARARSAMSFGAGLVCGTALVFAANSIRQGEGAGTTLAIVVSVLLALIFALRWAKTRKFMPAGMLFGLSVIELAVLLGSWGN